MKCSGSIAVAVFLCAMVFFAGCGPERTTTPQVPVLSGHVWVNSLGMRFLPVPERTGLLMSIWETRVRDFDTFVRATGHEASRGYYYYDNFSWKTGERDWKNPGFEQTLDHPVTGASWSDAVAFCHWLTETEQRSGVISRNQEYRLPSDEEWTLAATPGVEWPVPPNTANYSPELKIDSHAYTSPVGSFPPNQRGFFDMAGNLWEYCLDVAGSGGEFRVIRGGCWQNSHRRFLGIGARGACGMNVRISLYGFRVVLAEKKKIIEEDRP